MQIPYDILQLSLKGIQENWMMEGYITTLLAECHCDLFFLRRVACIPRGDRDAKLYLMTCSMSVVGNNVEIRNPHGRSITGPVETYARPTSERMWSVVQKGVHRRSAHRKSADFKYVCTPTTVHRTALTCHVERSTRLRLTTCICARLHGAFDYRFELFRTSMGGQHVEFQNCYVDVYRKMVTTR